MGRNRTGPSGPQINNQGPTVIIHCENLTSFFLSTKSLVSFFIPISHPFIIHHRLHHAPTQILLPLRVPLPSPNFDSFDQICNPHLAKTLCHPSMTLGSGGSSVVGQSLTALSLPYLCLFFFFQNFLLGHRIFSPYLVLPLT